MELEFHQLELRYERLRVRQPARERRLLASLADAGQQMPIVVVTAGSTYVVVDGHKRVRCLRRLQRDTVAAVVWEMAEAEALIFRHLLHTDATDSAFEQGWLLRTLHEQHGLALDALARRFDRSVSWVSRRLSLVRTLPEAVQQHVQDGRLVAHAAMKYLVPLARANATECRRFVEAIASHRFSTRQIGRLYQVYLTGPEATRELVLTDPLLVLRVTDDTPQAGVRPEASAPEALMTDLHILGADARRAHRRLRQGGGLLPPERERAWRLFDQVQMDFPICNDGVSRSCVMLDQGLRTAILNLRAKGHGIRQIARALQISRGTVRTVLQAGSPTVPRMDRAEKAEPYCDQILEAFDRCRGNLVRVHEELIAQGVAIAYPTLTAFCRRHGIGHAPPAPVGHYDFPPAREMQHDTSPHRVPIAGVEQRIETASLVWCYSRMLFFQAYPAFTRFYCKVFLTEALEYMGGAAATCMIDTTHVVVAAGTGARMVPAPEMAAFAERFGFVFRAHEKGDANRSARVERPFHFIEHNFFAGRTFADLPDLNGQARAFCDTVNATPKRHLHASPRELFAAERPHLRPLPLFVPEVYALHHRLVDVEGFVNVHGHRYSVPYLLIGRQLEVRETKDRIDVYSGPRLVASHAKVLGRTFTRVTVPAHRPPRGTRPSTQPSPEDQTLAQADPPVPAYAAALKQRSAGRGTLALRRLLALYREYPRAPFLQAVRLAAQYGLFDLDRLERLTLRVIAKDYFRLAPDDDEPES